jgi:hypothetical protein
MDGGAERLRTSDVGWKVLAVLLGLGFCFVSVGVAPPTAGSVQGDSLSVVLEEPDRALDPWVKATCTEAMGKIQAFFGLPFASGVRVRVFPVRAALTAYWRSAWGIPDLQPECWQVASGTASLLALLSPRVWKIEACEHDPADTIATKLLVTHELVHVFHAQRNPRPEFDGMDDLSWFVEGLATYVSGQLDRLHPNAARSAIDGGSAPSALAGAWSGKYRYGVAGSLVKYLDLTYGRPMLMALLPATTQEEILRKLGVREEVLLARWREWVLSENTE